MKRDFFLWKIYYILTSLITNTRIAVIKNIYQLEALNMKQLGDIYDLAYCPSSIINRGLFFIPRSVSFGVINYIVILCLDNQVCASAWSPLAYFSHLVLQKYSFVYCFCDSLKPGTSFWDIASVWFDRSEDFTLLHITSPCPEPKKVTNEKRIQHDKFAFSCPEPKKAMNKRIPVLQAEA